MKAESLKVRVINLPSDQGELAWAVFHKKDGFPSDHEKAFVKNRIKVVSKEPIEFTVDELEAGTFAVAIYQDMNENRKLDKNFLGIPTESIGFSNNPKIFMGPPKFIDAQFEFPQVKNIEVKMLR